MRSTCHVQRRELKSREVESGKGLSGEGEKGRHKGESVTPTHVGPMEERRAKSPGDPNRLRTTPPGILAAEEKEPTNTATNAATTRPKP